MKNMKKLLLILILICSTSLLSVGQNKKIYKINFTDPGSVVNAIFYAAQTRDFGIMQCLNDPFGDSDGDVKDLCSISNIAKQNEEYGGDDNIKKKLDDFVKYFELGRITGQITYSELDGFQSAKVPFWFNHPGGESRSNEVMNLVNRYGNWYLSSF
jgi:hypothetical protein